MNTNAPDLNTTSDGSLVSNIRAGQNDAATELYERYARRLTEFARRQTSQKFASRFDPEDVIQSVFRTFFRRVSDGQFAVPAGEEIWQLLLVIALNKVRRLGRFHQQQQRSVDRSTSHDGIENLTNQSNESELTILNLVIGEMLAHLPERHRNIVELRIQGYTTSEIAAESGRCKRTVERVLRQFRNEVADFLDKSHDADNA